MLASSQQATSTLNLVSLVCCECWSPIDQTTFIESFVKEIIVIPGDALIRYTVPMPDDSFLAGRATEKVPLDASVLSTVHVGPP